MTTCSTMTGQPGDANPEGQVAARGGQAPEDAAGHWLRLEREHFAAFTSGAISFEEQRRRRVRAFLQLVSSAGVGEEDLDELFAEYVTFYESHWVAFDDVGGVLADLAAAGYVLGVLTNGQRTQQVAKLARIGLLDRFAVVVASSGTADRWETRSRGVRRPMPAPGNCARVDHVRRR